MNEAVEQAEVPVVGNEPEEREQIEEAGSLADHAAQFSPEARQKAAEKEAKGETEAEKPPLKEIRPVDQQRRGEKGEFAEGRKPLKAKDAVARINELTARAKGAEERLAAAEAELAKARATHAPKQEIREAERKVEKAEAATIKEDPEPKETDEKYKGDYGLYLEDKADWRARKAAREEWAALRKSESDAAEQSRVEESHRATLKSWQGRVNAAKEKHADFEAVAFGPTRIPAGSPVDAFIMEDDSGAEVLYYLQHHPDELDSLMGMPVLQQVKRLSLLAERLLPSTGAAGVTPAATQVKTVVLPPKPPTGVRTEAQSHGTLPTSGEAGSIAEHARQHHKRK